MDSPAVQLPSNLNAVLDRFVAACQGDTRVVAAFLGGCGINGINREDGYANLGYWVRRSAMGQGVAPAAVRLVRDWVFAQTDLGRGVVRLDRSPDCEREPFELGVRDPSRPGRREALALDEGLSQLSWHGNGAPFDGVLIVVAPI